VAATDWLSEHGDAMWRFAISRVSPHVAEDVIQETLLAAVAKRAAFEERSAVETWLIGILIHKIADHFRRRARECPDERSGPTSGAEMADFKADGMWMHPPGAWEGRPDEELLTHLEECRDRLPLNLRDAIELRDMRQLPAHAVCKVLGITPTNLWTRLHRARSLLRRCIDDRAGGKVGRSRS
jgi:RNA polymerase sigma factor (sigma-70 family)